MTQTAPFTSPENGWTQVVRPQSWQILRVGPMRAVSPMRRLAYLDRSADAAAGAFRAWSRSPACDRLVILLRAADLLRECAAEIAKLMGANRVNP